MFSFIRKYAETINGIGLYPKLALFLFLLVFIAMTLFALKANKDYIARLASQPLDDSSSNNLK